VVDRDLGLIYSDQLSQRLGERFRTLARARDDENGGLAVMGVGQVNGPLPWSFRELCLFYRTNNADDREEFRLVRFVAMRQALAERAAIRPVAPGEIFVHNANAFRPMRIR
jgi:hypothetical protein